MTDSSSAQPPPRPGDSTETVDYLIVKAGDELYAIPGVAVREVARWRELTPVPGAPSVLPGIINQRGVVLSVVDLRHLLGLPAGPPDRFTRLVVVQQETVDLALLVDAVIDLLPFASSALAQPPAALDPQRVRLLAAVARHNDRPLGIINLGALITALQEEL